MYDLCMIYDLSLYVFFFFSLSVVVQLKKADAVHEVVGLK